MHRCALSFALFWIHSIHTIRVTIGGEVLTIRSVRWYAVSLLFVPVWFNLSRSPPWFVPQAADLQEPINRVFAWHPVGFSERGSLAGSWKQRRVQWGYLPWAPKLPGHRGRLGPFLEGFCWAANPLLSLRPRGTERSWLLLVLEHIAIPCWLAKPCQHLWEWSFI